MSTSQCWDVLWDQRRKRSMQENRVGDLPERNDAITGQGFLN